MDLEPTGIVLGGFSCNGGEAEILTGLFLSHAKVTGDLSTFLGGSGGVSMTVNVLSDAVELARLVAEEHPDLGMSASCESNCFVRSILPPLLSCPLSSSIWTLKFFSSSDFSVGQTKRIKKA